MHLSLGIILDFRFLFAYIEIMHLTKRQKEILGFIKIFIKEYGYSPTMKEIGAHFKLSSSATIHKHLTNLEMKGFIQRSYNRSRAVEVVEEGANQNTHQFPLLGIIAAGKPIEALENKESISILPEFSQKDIYILKVKGNSMIDDHIKDGDYVIVEKRIVAENGETVVALLDNENVTLKRFYREKDHIRLQPSNPKMKPIIIKKGNLKIQGVVIGVLRKFK